MANYVTCKCGNMVIVKKPHDFSVLPCPTCKEKVVVGGVVCVGCGKVCYSGEVEGSLKHPYCKDCFKRVWNDNYKEYFYWLETEHK
jgi:hypothetical protein